jgi:hypothetical protein
MRPPFCFKAQKESLMKKISLFLCALSLTATVFAQQAAIGLKAGLNVANLKNSGYDMGSKLGFNGGLLAHIHLSPNLALQPEAVYSSQGAKYTVSGSEHNLSLNYINIPLQLQYMFANGFRLQTGPQVGFLAGVKDKIGNNETGYFTSQDFKTVDFSWSAGLSYLSTSGLGVDGRYNFGISDINNTGGNEIKNNVFQLGLFYMLNSNATPARHSHY